MAPKARAKSRARSSSTSAKSKAKAKPKPKANASLEKQAPWTPEDKAAIRVQAAYRGYLARRLSKSLREDKRKYEADVAEAIRQAELSVMQVERRKQEADRKRDAEKRAKARALAEKTRELLLAAFDGEGQTVLKLIDGGLSIDAADGNGTTALSEAASAGHQDVVQFLLERKSSPNSRGEFQRTPLWRAAYAGHEDVVRLLLDCGGDPRLYDAEVCKPIDIAFNENILMTLRNWDEHQTDDLVEEYEEWRAEQESEQNFRIKQAMQTVDTEFEQAKSCHQAAQRALAGAKAKLRDIVKEFGLQLAAGSQDAKLSCELADQRVTEAEGHAAAAQARFDKANLARMTAAENHGATSGLLGITVGVTNLNNVLIRDIGDRIANADKWPLLVDPTDCGKKMLHYAGCAVRSFWIAEDMEPESIRRGLLYMIRAGSTFVVDLFCFGAGVDLSLISEPFNRVREGLFEELNSRTILATPKGKRWPLYRDLIHNTERDVFGTEHFDETRSSRFKFIVITSSEAPHVELLEAFDVLRVVT